MPVAISAGTATAIAAGASAAATVGTAIAGAVGSDGISSASSKARQLSQDTINEARTNYQNDRVPYQNYLYSGQNALGELNGLSGTYGADAAAGAMANFKASPGYQYQIQQGLQAVDAGAAAKGILRSGATLQAEQTLGSNLANQDFQQYVNNLNTLAGYGLTAAQGQANTTAAYNNLLTGQATNQEGILTNSAASQASIYGNSAQQLGNGITNALNNYDYQNQLYNSNVNNALSSTPSIGSTSGGQTFGAGGYTTNNTFNAETGF